MRIKIALALLLFAGSANASQVFLWTGTNLEANCNGYFSPPCTDGYGSGTFALADSYVRGAPLTLSDIESVEINGIGPGLGFNHIYNVVGFVDPGIDQLSFRFQIASMNPHDPDTYFVASSAFLPWAFGAGEARGYGGSGSYLVEVPEPYTFGMLAAGMFAIVVGRRRFAK